VRVGRGDEELDWRFAKVREIDALAKDLTDGINAERVEAVRRDDPRHQIHHEIAEGRVERPTVHQPVERRSLDWTEPCSVCNPTPIGVEGRPCALGAAPHEAANQNRAVHCAGGCAGDRFDLQPRLLEEAVEHAPGERAMGSAALER
jgi:hypothetical protein